eukprot:TRINITY_DN343_c0_g1_i1.p4 TRINITY_DN343_c0_g1~~TRINITY_DN343_c0_g1_i1.p4  ORF type:complete len:373 (+),score=80.90 TRINITY_DN343_c0_g1_i1:1003-2121(+)
MFDDAPSWLSCQLIALIQVIGVTKKARPQPRLDRERDSLLVVALQALQQLCRAFVFFGAILLRIRFLVARFHQRVEVDGRWRLAFLLQALHFLLRLVAVADDVREDDDQRDHDDLDADKGNGTPVDVCRLDRRRRDRAQVEQREAEGRVHERGLHVDREQYAEPDQVDAQLVRHRGEQRHDDEGQFEEVEEEGEQEDQDIDDDQEAHLAARQGEQQVLNPQVAIDRAENQAEDCRTNQNEDDEGRQLAGGFHGLLEQLEGKALAGDGQDQRTGGSHGAAFGRRGDAKEDGAEHQEDQQQRRHHGGDDPQQQLETAQGARFRRQGRAGGGFDDAENGHVADIKAGQDQAGDHCTFVHVADRFAELVGHDDQDQ